MSIWHRPRARQLASQAEPRSHTDECERQRHGDVRDDGAACHVNSGTADRRGLRRQERLRHRREKGDDAGRVRERDPPREREQQAQGDGGRRARPPRGPRAPHEQAIEQEGAGQERGRPRVHGHEPGSQLPADQGERRHRRPEHGIKHRPCPFVRSGLEQRTGAPRAPSSTASRPLPGSAGRAPPSRRTPSPPARPMPICLASTGFTAGVYSHTLPTCRPVTSSFCTMRSSIVLVVDTAHPRLSASASVTSRAVARCGPQRLEQVPLGLVDAWSSAPPSRSPSGFATAFALSLQL